MVTLLGMATGYPYCVYSRSCKIYIKCTPAPPHPLRMHCNSLNFFFFKIKLKTLIIFVPKFGYKYDVVLLLTPFFFIKCGRSICQWTHLWTKVRNMYFHTGVVCQRWYQGTAPIYERLLSGHFWGDKHWLTFYVLDVMDHFSPITV